MSKRVWRTWKVEPDYDDDVSVICWFFEVFVFDIFIPIKDNNSKNLDLFGVNDKIKLMMRIIDLHESEVYDPYNIYGVLNYAKRMTNLYIADWSTFSKEKKFDIYHQLSAIFQSRLQSFKGLRKTKGPTEMVNTIIKFRSNYRDMKDYHYYDKLYDKIAKEYIF